MSNELQIFFGCFIRDRVDCMYIYVGNMSSSGNGGISVFYYSKDEESLRLLNTQFPELSVGYISVDESSSRLFCVNECVETNDLPGGQVLCFQIDHKTGNLTLLSKANTHTVLPCYLHYIPEDHQLLVCNHAKRDWILKLNKTSDGDVSSQKIFDDAALEVFSVTQEGIIVGPTAYWAAPYASDSLDNPHLHSITYDPTTRQSFVSDTGSGLIYSFSHNGRGAPAWISTVKPNGEGSAPRYGVLHPTLPIAYFNSEKQNALYAFRRSECKLIPMQVIPVLDDESSSLEPIMQSAILINHSGNVLYTLVRKNQSISAFAIAKDGTLSFLQAYPIGIEGPRAMMITPDDDCIFVACSKGEAVIRIQINSDGSLKSHTLEKTPLLFPSSIAMFNP